MEKFKSLRERLDVRFVLIVLLILVSVGHVGRLFADREDVRQAFVGYVLAVSIDGVLAISLYEAAHVRKRSHRLFALFVFVFTCLVSAGFNYSYYRQNYPEDPVVISLLLGSVAPVLAALLSVMCSFGKAERTEAEQSERAAERSHELEKHRIEQAERTKREQIAEQERTKRERAKARAEKAKANAIAQAQRTVTEQPQRTTTERAGGRLKAGELDGKAQEILLQDPGIGPRPLARLLDCSPSTAAGVLKRIKSNGGG